MRAIERRRGYAVKGETPIPIPEGAVRIEYVENTSTTRLDTGYTPTADTVIQFKFMPITLSGDITLGYYITDSNDFRFFNAGGRIYFDSFGGTRANTGTGKQVVNNIYELELGNFYVKDLIAGSVLVDKTPKYTGIGNRTIFLNRDPYVGGRPATKNRWYYLKLYEGSVLKMYLIPIRIETVGYLYDVVSQQTLSTAAGDWALGPDLT